MDSKLIIEELKRIQEIMGIQGKIILVEGNPIQRLIGSIEELLTNAGDVTGKAEKRIGKVGEQEINIPQSTYDEMISKLGSADYYNALSTNGKRILTQIIMNTPKLKERLYKDSIDVALKIINKARKRKGNPPIGEQTLLRIMAADLDKLKKTNPLASAQDVLIRRGVDAGEAKILDDMVGDKIEPFLPEKTWKGKIYKPKSKGEFNRWYSRYEPIFIKEFRNKVVKAGLRNQKKIEEQIQVEIEDAMAKMQAYDEVTGRSNRLEITDNLENIWFLISGARKWGIQKGYQEFIEEFLSKEGILKGKELDNFLESPGVKNAIKAYDNTAVQELANLQLAYFRAWIKALSDATFVKFLWEVTKQIRTGNFSKEAILKSLPDWSRYKNLISFRSVLSDDEIYEFAMRQGLFGHAVSIPITYYIWDYWLLPALSAGLKSAITEWVSKPQLKKELEFYKDYCRVGLLKDENGQRVDPSNCETYFTELERISSKELKQFIVDERGYNKWLLEWKKEMNDENNNFFEGVGKGIWDTLWRLTNTDDFANFVWENYQAAAGVAEGEDSNERKKFFFENWDKEFRERFETVLNPLNQKLKEEGYPEEKTQFYERMKNDIIKSKRDNPWIDQTKGDYINTEESFQKYLVDTGRNQSEAEKGGVAPEFESVKNDRMKKKFFLIDKSQPVSETNKKFEFFNGAFWPEGTIPSVK